MYGLTRFADVSADKRCVSMLTRGRTHWVVVTDLSAESELMAAAAIGEFVDLGLPVSNGFEMLLRLMKTLYAATSKECGDVDLCE